MYHFKMLRSPRDPHSTQHDRSHNAPRNLFTRKLRDQKFHLQIEALLNGVLAFACGIQVMLFVVTLMVMFTLASAGVQFPLIISTSWQDAWQWCKQLEVLCEETLALGRVKWKMWHVFLCSCYNHALATCELGPSLPVCMTKMVALQDDVTQLYMAKEMGKISSRECAAGKRFGWWNFGQQQRI